MGNNCYRDELRDKPTHEAKLSQPIGRRQSITQKDQISHNQDEFVYFETLNNTNTSRICIRQEEADDKVTIKDFQLLKILGKGSFGKVMLVEHKEKSIFYKHPKSLEQLYAMKVLLKGSIKTERQMRHTMTERVILEMMNNDFMVKLHYAFQTDHKLYLVVDFMGGGELFFYLRKYIRFSEDIVQYFSAQILLAIEFMHQNNIIYRDLKPENILLDDKGHLKLADFGLSKILENEQIAYSLCGTPEYLAPEIITSTETGYTKQCDWWSFGAVMYEMLTGAPPFYSNNRKEILRKILSFPVPIPDYLSDDAQNLLQNLLVINPTKRIGYKSDAQEIKSHPFFAKLDFKKLLNREITSPSQFQNNQGEFKFFDQNLIKDEVKDTPIQNKAINKQYNFTNFSYKKIDEGESIHENDQFNQDKSNFYETQIRQSQMISETYHTSFTYESLTGPSLDMAQEKSSGLVPIQESTESET